MKVFLRLFFVLLILSCNSKPAVQEATASSKVKVGQPAPSFSLQSTTSKMVSLSDFRGKVVLLDFWATWCPPCRMSMPVLVRLDQKFKDKGFVIIGINLDENKEAVVPFMKKTKVEYSVLYGSDANINEDYNISGIPAFFLLDGTGKLVKQYAGFYPGLEKEWEKDVTTLLTTKK